MSKVGWQRGHLWAEKKKSAKTQGCAAFRELTAGADGATAKDEAGEKGQGRHDKELGLLPVGNRAPREGRAL